MISREFPPYGGGIGWYVYHLSRKLAEKANNVTVITRGSASKTRSETTNGIEVFEAPFFPVYPFHIFAHGVFVNRILRSLESKFDMVHLHSPLPPPVQTSLPVVLTVHTPVKVDARYHEAHNPFLLAEKMQSELIYPPIELKLIRMSRRITSVSQSVAKELSEYGVDPSEVTVVGNGVDEKAFAPGQKEKGEKYVLYTGVLRSRKGLFDLLQCGKCVVEAYPELKFFIVGKGPFLSILERKVRKMRLQENMVFKGYVTRDRLIQIYQNAYLQVVPSHYEGLPTVLLEGMSCGLPVVATAVGGNVEVISSGVNGFLVPPKAPDAMSKIILQLLDNPELARNVGMAARQTIEDNFTWDRVADNFIRCYESVL